MLCQYFHKRLFFLSNFGCSSTYYRCCTFVFVRSAHLRAICFSLFFIIIIVFKEKCHFPTKTPVIATVEVQPNEVPVVLKIVLQAYCAFHAIINSSKWHFDSYFFGCHVYIFMHLNIFHILFFCFSYRWLPF